MPGRRAVAKPKEQRRNRNPRIASGRGSDRLFGGGYSYLQGNAGNDLINGCRLSTAVASYVSAPGPVNVKLRLGTATGDGTDILRHIHVVYGSGFADDLRGSAYGATYNNTPSEDEWTELLVGFGGSDYIDGNGGPDRLYGDDGSDRLNSKDGVEGNDRSFGGPQIDEPGSIGDLCAHDVGDVLEGCETEES